MSAGVRISPSLKKSSICLSPSPSMSKALREQKCLSPSTACAGQTRWPVQRRTTSALAGFLVNLAQRGRAADRTGFQGTCRVRRLGRALVAHGLDDLRDDVAGPLHHDGVADPHVLAGDLVLVVQRRVRDDHAADGDGPELATGVSAPVRPTWISIVSQQRRRPLGRKLVRHRPAGRARDEAEPLLRAQDRRPCRRRRRYRSRGSSAGLRSRGNGRASRPPSGRAPSADWSAGRSAASHRMASSCVLAKGSLTSPHA